MESAIFRRRNSDILLALAGERTGAGDKRQRGARPAEETLWLHQCGSRLSKYAITHMLRFRCGELRSQVLTSMN
jgi:hypothetical protein